MAGQDKCIRDKGENMAKIIVNNENKKSTIAPEIYGHFSEHLGRCIYEGLFVGENSDIPNVNGMRTDVVDALKEMKIPVLRWPGGCFADEYHWMDGIGPKEKRKKMINTHWGGVVEDNSFGTHEFFVLCRQLGCKTYVTGNLGSGTVREMSEWVEYITFNGVSPMADLRKENGTKSRGLLIISELEMRTGDVVETCVLSIMQMNTADTRLMSEIMQAISQSIKSAVVQMWMTMSGQIR